MRSDVTFMSEGEQCAGWLYLPPGLQADAKVPVIVVAHGMSGVKEQGLAEIAERFASAGFAALVFDFRHFGASGGAPRGQLFPQEMVEDYRNAISWAGQHPAIDSERVGIWGTSYSGGLAVRTATIDRRIKAVVAQAPSLMNPDAWRAMDPDRWDAVGRFLIDDRVSRYASGEIRYMPVVAPDGEPCVLPGSESYRFFMDARDAAPGWRNEITVASLEKIREFDPVSLIHMLAPAALLVVAAAEDSLIPLSAVSKAFDQALEPKRMAVLPIGHFEIYAEPWLSQATDAAIEWYRQYLV